MSDQNEADNKKKFMLDTDDFEKIEKACKFVMSLCNEINLAQYEHLDDLGPMQREQIDTMLEQVPLDAGKGYMLTFPAGLAYTLMQMSTEGAGSAAAMAMTGAFTAMAAVTGQFFLVRINKELKKINQNLDKIIGFLYGDKKAELLAEISFTKQASENYRFIMAHEEQRIATISSLQQARKVAIKDIEFYQNDLDLIASRKPSGTSEVKEDFDTTFQLFECIDLSVQLYALSGSLEVYYSQNYDPEYVQNVRGELCNYIGMCKSSMISSFSKLLPKVESANPTRLNAKGLSQPDAVAKIEDKISFLKTGWEPSIVGPLGSLLDEITKKRDYYLTSGGDVYVKKLPN